MAQQVKLTQSSRLVVWASICVVVAALYFAQEVLIPLALAILFTFLLTPLVSRLERWRLGRVPSVLIVVLTAVGLLATLGWVVEQQVVSIAGQLPGYTDEIKAKLVKLQQFGGKFLGAAQSLETVVKDMAPPPVPATAPATGPATAPTTEPTTAPATQPGEAAATESAAVAPAAPSPGVSPTPPPPPPPPDVAPPFQSSTATPGGAALPDVSPQNPLPVRNYPESPSPVGVVMAYLGSALSPLATAGMVLVFVIFMLLSREDLRDRLIRLLGGGGGHVTLTTKALSDAADRISRYLLMQLIVNATYGVAISLGLWLIGKFSGEKPFPSVLLWGLLCCVLRFIPYIGPWIAAAFPVLLAFAFYKSTGVFLATLGLFVVIELWSNNVMEPWLYGSSTGMSAVAILVAAVFWTWLWGAIGLLLSTPLTVCLVVLGKHVPQLRFLDILLGDEPVLDPPTRLYQRLLARDEDEATEFAQELLGEKQLEGVYDGVLLPVLSMADKDRRRDKLDPETHGYIRRAMRGIVIDLADTMKLADIRKTSDDVVARAKGQAPTPGPGGGDGSGSPAADPARGGAAGAKPDKPPIVCLPAHDEDDEIVGLMLAQLLERRGYAAFALTQAALASEMVETVEKHAPGAVCVSALPPSAVPHSRYLVKRLQARFPDLPLVIGLWTVTADLNQARQQISPNAPVRVTTTLADAMEQLRQAAQPALLQAMAAKPG